MEKNPTAWAIFKIGGTLLAVWYLLLIYLFPNGIPYGIAQGDDDQATLIYSLLFLAAFLFLIASAFMYYLRLLRLLTYTPAAHDDSHAAGVLFPAAESHFLFHLRRVSLLSVMEFLLMIVRDMTAAKGNEDVKFLIAVTALPFLILVDVGLRRLTTSTPALTTPGWAASGWIAFATVLAAVIGVASVGIPRDREIWASPQFIIAGASWGVVVGTAVIVSYRRRADMARDVRRLLHRREGSAPNSR